LKKKTIILIISLITLIALAGFVLGSGLIVKTANKDFQKDPEFYKELGNYFVKSGELDKAAVAYESCLLLGDDKDVRNNLAIIYHSQGKYSEAISQLRILIQSDSNNPSYHYDLAINLVDQFRNIEDKNIQELEEALSDYEKADALQPGYMHARENIDVLKRILSE